LEGLKGRDTRRPHTGVASAEGKGHRKKPGVEVEKEGREEGEGMPDKRLTKVSSGIQCYGRTRVHGVKESEKGEEWGGDVDLN